MNDKDNLPDRDVRIGAYLDGEMSPADRAVFESELAADRALADHVRRYRQNDALLRSALSDAKSNSIDQDLLGMLGLVNADVVSLDSVRRERAALADAAASSRATSARRWQWPAAGALAAGLAAMLVFGSQQSPPPPIDLQRSPVFQAALQDLPSASTARLSSGATISPRLTFVAGDGRFCREFLIVGTQESEAGIACRSSSSWLIEALATSHTKEQDGSQLQTAGGDDNAALDAAYRRLAGSDPFDRATENRLISNNWTKSSKNTVTLE